MIFFHAQSFVGQFTAVEEQEEEDIIRLTEQEADVKREMEGSESNMPPDSKFFVVVSTEKKWILPFYNNLEANHVF